MPKPAPRNPTKRSKLRGGFLRPEATSHQARSMGDTDGARHERTTSTDIDALTSGFYQSDTRSEVVRAELAESRERMEAERRRKQALEEEELQRAAREADEYDQRMRHIERLQRRANRDLDHHLARVRARSVEH